MTVYVDPLVANGWVLRGRRLKNCHMFSDQMDLGELHVMATRIGMRLSWFQNKLSVPHYDLTPARRAAAIAAGAVAVDKHKAVSIWRARRAKLKEAA